MNKNKDSVDLRVVQVINSDSDKTLTGMILHIDVKGTLPIITTDDIVMTSIVKEDTTTTPTTPSDVINFITDTEYTTLYSKERFIFMSRLISPLTQDEIFIVYDRKYSDILLIPTLSTLEVVNKLIAGTKRTFNINGYRLGSGCETNDKNPGQLLSNNENTRYNIMEANEYNPNIKAMSVIISNLTQQNSSAGITHSKVNSGVIITYDNQQLATCINLGKVSDLLKDVSVGLPLYLLYRYSPTSYGISYIDQLKSGDYDLLVFLPF